MFRKGGRLEPGLTTPRVLRRRGPAVKEMFGPWPIIKRKIVNVIVLINIRTRSSLDLYTRLSLPILYGVWHTNGRSWGASYIAQSTCNSIAIVREVQVGEGNARMIDSCIKASKYKTISCKGQTEPMLIHARATACLKHSDKRNVFHLELGSFSGSHKKRVQVTRKL